MRLISFIYIQTQWEDSQCCASVTRYCYFTANYGAGQGRLHQTPPPVEPVECDQLYQTKNRNLIESRMCGSTASSPASTLYARCESELRRGRIFRPPANTTFDPTFDLCDLCVKAAHQGRSHYRYL